MYFPRRLSAFVTGSIFALLMACGQRAHALDSHIPIDDYNRTMWAARDGVPQQIQSMAQTPDGWLWLGTLDGLYRYDGVKFEHYPLAGPLNFPRTRIVYLLAQANGDLWISYYTGGISVLRKNGTVEDFVIPGMGLISTITGLLIDTDGSLWAASEDGIFHLHGGSWTLVLARHGPPVSSEVNMLLDQYGRIWIGDRNGVYLFDRDKGKFEQLAQKTVRGTLIQSPDGRLWAVEEGVVHSVDTPPVKTTLPRPAAYNQATSTWAGQFDRDGNLWKLECPVGVCRIAGAGASTLQSLIPERLDIARLDQSSQSGTYSANAMLEDREGDIWIASQSGLVRLRENKLHPVHVPVEGTGYGIRRDADGRIWADSVATKTLWQLSPDAPPVAERGHKYREIAIDRDGALLLATRRTIERRFKGHIEQIPLPPDRSGKAADLTVFGMLDDGKVLWMGAIETGLMGFVDGHWLPRSAFNLPPDIFTSAPGGKGQLWLALKNGTLIFYDNGKMTHYDVSALGLVSGIFPGTDMILSGEKGTAILKEGTLQRLQVADADVLRNVSGLVITRNGDHWFNGSMGIVMVSASAWRAAADQRQALRYELLGALEGYPGSASLLDRQPTGLDGGDGQLWFRATGGIVRVDTRHLTMNRVQPHVQILRVNTTSGSYDARAGLKLPAGAQAFNIAFTAPGLRLPEGVRFQYRLSGVDEQWQSAGTRRTAFYTNVAPGQYQFAVRAVNEDGVAGAAETALAFSITPTIFQTRWFKGLCMLAVAASAYGLYRYRVRRVAAALTRSMTVRMAERERIARTLHDTILQSVQSIILRLHVMSRDLPIGSTFRAALEALLLQADKTVSEGRDQIQELRRALGADLPGLVTDSGKDLADLYPGMTFALRVTGLPRTMPPDICEEIGEIVREAMRNACRHSGGDTITVDIAYQFGALALRIADNGTGIGAHVPGGGERQRHWGLTGMRERAERIGAVLDITGIPSEGTTISLSVPLRRSSRPETDHGQQASR